MRAWLDRLATFSRLIAFDKRGTGLSDRVPDDRLPDLETRMDDVRAVMDAAGSQRAFLLGHSEGGLLAALFATTYPARTAGVVFFSSDVRGAWAPDHPWGTTREEFERELEAVERGWGNGAFARSMAADLAPPGQGRGLPRLGGQVLSAERKPERRDRHRPHVVRDRCPTHRAVAWRPEPGPLASRRRLCGREPIPRRARARHHRRGASRIGPRSLDWRRRPDGRRDRGIHLRGEGRGCRARSHAGDGAVHRHRWFHGTSPRARRSCVGELLEAHHARVRAQLARFRGREIDTAGDGFLATFDGPARGVRCAQAIARSVRGLGSPCAPGSIRGTRARRREHPRDRRSRGRPRVRRRWGG